MATRSFTRDFLRLFSGPIIWAIHFLGVYGLTGVLCARPALRQEWLGIGIVTWSVGACAIAAIAIIAVIHMKDWRARAQSGKLDFLHWTASGLGLLSAIAIAWEALPLFFVPKCG